jgi:hypothetical protein
MPDTFVACKGRKLELVILGTQLEHSYRLHVISDECDPVGNVGVIHVRGCPRTPPCCDGVVGQYDTRQRRCRGSGTNSNNNE